MTRAQISSASDYGDTATSTPDSAIGRRVGSHERLVAQMEEGIVGLVQVAGVAPDGCPVRVYELLPDVEPPPAMASVANGVRVLDLGAGTGRLTRPLAQRGAVVTAVDNSLEMLASITGAAVVQADIEGLRLPGRFDAVVLASHLVNTPDVDRRRAYFDTVAHHLDEHGVAYIEWHPPSWFDRQVVGVSAAGLVGEVAVELEVHAVTSHGLDGTVSYRCAREVWRQAFTAARLSSTDLADQLSAAGLELIVGDVESEWQTAKLAFKASERNGNKPDPGGAQNVGVRPSRRRS